MSIFSQSRMQAEKSLRGSWHFSWDMNWVRNGVEASPNTTRSNFYTSGSRSTSKFLQRNLNFGWSSGGICICKYISLPSQATCTAIGKWWKRRSTSNRFVNSLVPGRMWSFKDIPWNLALMSNTILFFVVDLSGRHTGKWGRYQVLFSLFSVGYTLRMYPLST